MRPPRRFIAATVGLLVLGWLVFAILGHRLASVIASRAAGVIARMAKGKIADPSTFIYERAFDALWLATILLLLILIFFRLKPRLMRRSRLGSWVWLSILAFILLNVWVGSAMQRALFWAILYSGEGSSNYTQFKLKEKLMAEAPPIPRAILLGSSQVRAQIDENLLNRELTDRLWTTELHFPGSAAFDVALVSRHLRHQRVDLLISYVSEGYFFSGSSFSTLPYFASFTDVRWFHEIGADEVYRHRGFYIGILGSISPLFRSREPIGERILGKSFTTIKQMEYNQALETNLVKRAEQAAPGPKSDKFSDLQKRAFDSFLREAASRRARVIILVGQFNPLLGERINPALRPEMLAFLHDMARKHQHLTLVEDAPFLRNTVADYKDLTHISEEAQERFTRGLADFLRTSILK